MANLSSPEELRLRTKRIQEIRVQYTKALQTFQKTQRKLLERLFSEIDSAKIEEIHKRIHTLKP